MADPFQAERRDEIEGYVVAEQKRFMGNPLRLHCSSPALPADVFRKTFVGKRLQLKMFLSSEVSGDGRRRDFFHGVSPSMAEQGEHIIFSRCAGAV